MQSTDVSGCMQLHDGKATSSADRGLDRIAQPVGVHAAAGRQVGLLKQRGGLPQLFGAPAAPLLPRLLWGGRPSPLRHAADCQLLRPGAVLASHKSDDETSGGLQGS